MGIQLAREGPEAETREWINTASLCFSYLRPRSVQRSAPGLAALVEQGAEAREISRVIEEHVSALSRAIGRAPDRAILGSTHYEVVADLFRRALPGTELIHQPDATAEAPDTYLKRHPEYRVATQGARRFLTTGRPGIQHA